MRPDRGIDLSRLVRLATFGGAILAGALAYFTNEPAREALAARLDDARTQLRSDDIVLAETVRLRAKREALRIRYARLFAANPEAIFLRELDWNVRRHALALVSTNARHDGNAEPRDASGFGRVALTVELRGSYRHLLEAVVDLSRGKEIVAVDPPNFRRDGRSLVASVPVTIFEPAAPGDGNARSGEPVR
jgi:hypothetical protein